MDPKPNERQLAKDLYLQTDKTQAEIADILNVNRRTVYLWVKNGKWAEMKAAAKQAPRYLLQEFHNHMGALNDRIRVREDRCPTTQEVEMLRKLLAMTGEIDRRNLGCYIEVFEEFTTYMYKQDVPLAQKVSLHANNYIKGNVGDKDFRYDRSRSQTVREVINNLANDPEDEDPTPEPPKTENTEKTTDTPQPETGKNVIPLYQEEDKGKIIPFPGTKNSDAAESSDAANSLSTGEGRGEVIKLTPFPTAENSAAAESSDAANSLSTRGEGRGEVKSDTNAITNPADGTTPKQLTTNEKQQNDNTNQYPTGCPCDNGITPLQLNPKHPNYDPPANEVLGKG